MINLEALAQASTAYGTAGPFDHLVVDDFFAADVAQGLADEFPAYGDAVWHVYDNPLEIKKTCNSWLQFPSLTYRVFSLFNSPGFIARIESLLGIAPLYADPGLNGGGWHTHGRGGKLNTHLDYSLHPKLGLQRKLNLIVYLTPGWQEAWDGGLGLWGASDAGDKPGELVKVIPPLFNRAVLFDTTQQSWHGLPEPLRCPQGVQRNSLAVYYLTDPPADIDERGKALFAPSKDQQDDPAVAELIARRADVGQAGTAYRT